MRRSPWPVRLYGALVGLLPPDTRAYRAEMEAAFDEQWAEAAGAGSRAALAARTLGRLPGVLAVEWLEYLGARGAPGRTTTRGGGEMTGMLTDLRLAARTLAKAPAFTLSTVALLAVGVGAVTTIVTLVDHVLLRPLPYPDPERLVHLGNPSHPGPFFHALDGVGGVASWAAAWPVEENVRVGGQPRLLEVAQVSEGFFELFGAVALRGRLLAEEDFRASDAVVVSERAWREIWGGDPGLVGRTVSVGGDPVVVVGVLEPGFEAPEALMDAGVELWRPLAWSSPELTGTNYNVVRIVGRLGPGSSLASVQRQVDGLVERLAAEDGQYRTRDGSPRPVPVETLAEATTDDVREGLGLLLAAVTVLLLVACANVAHLFLARGLGRTREMAVRRALGAGSGALARLLLAESLLVGVAGGILGAGLAAGGLTAFLALTPAALPRSGSVAMDLRILAFALGTATLTVLLFGLVPALRTARADLAERLRGGGRGATGGRRVAGLRNLLVAGEVALSLVLLAGALLLARSFATVRAQDPGFETEGVWTAPLNPDPGTTEEYRALARDVTRAAADIPGVLHAAVGLTMPMELIGGNRCCWGTRLEVDGVPLDETRVTVHPVTVDYVPTLGIPLLAGRTWTASEAEARPVPVLLNEPLARAAFGSPEAAVGRSVREGGEDPPPMTVVGVVADTRHYGLDEDHGPALYLPMEQVPFAPPRAHLAVRLAPGAGDGVGGALREAIWSVAPGLPVPVTRPMEAWMARGTAERRFLGALFLSFAVVGLLLAAGGLYGTLLFVAGERRREMGIRLALGASRGRIERRLLVSGLAVSGVGIGVGLAGSWYGGRFLERWVWGVEPGDPATLLLASAVLLATAGVASWFPARNAARTDPVRTLREE